MNHPISIYFCHFGCWWTSRLQIRWRHRYPIVDIAKTPSQMDRQLGSLVFGPSGVKNESKPSMYLGWESSGDHSLKLKLHCGKRIREASRYTYIIASNMYRTDVFEYTGFSNCDMKELPTWHHPPMDQDWKVTLETTGGWPNGRTFKESTVDWIQWVI